MASLFQSLPSYKLMTTPVLINSHKRQRPAVEPSDTSVQALETRQAPIRCHIASWDNKRGQCANCKQVFLKNQSRWAGFCSVDCKSTALYMGKVKRTIQTVCAIQHDEPVTAVQTFSEFGAEDLVLLGCCGEKKAFSALA